jgi:hypothetical protein
VLWVDLTGKHLHLASTRVAGPFEQPGFANGVKVVKVVVIWVLQQVVVHQCPTIKGTWCCHICCTA